MKNLIFLFLIGLCGCSSKLIIPDQPMMTPEVIGKSFGLEAIIQKTPSIKAGIDLQDGNDDEPLVYDRISDNSAYLVNVGLFRRLDFFVNTLMNSTNIYGIKWQLLGETVVQSQKPSRGHKLALTFGHGMKSIANDKPVDYNIDTKVSQGSLIHGYRLGRKLMIYESLSYTDFSFEGEISSSDPALDGLKPAYNIKALALSLGLEFSLWRIKVLGEAGYRRLNASHTKDTDDAFTRWGAGFFF